MESTPQVLFWHFSILSADGFKNTRLPDAVTGSAVAPAALHLTETCDAALFPPEATARPVNKLHMWFRINRKMQKQTDHLPVCEYTRLSRTYSTHTQRLALRLLPLGTSVSWDQGCQTQFLEGHCPAEISSFS